MAGLIRRINKSITEKIGDIFSKIVGSFVDFERGRFVVKKGKHEIRVPLNICTSKVWVQIEASIIDGCGQVPVNKVGYRLLHKEIIFFVEAATENCTVEWYATEDHDDRNKWDRWERERGRWDRRDRDDRDRRDRDDRGKGHRR